MNEEHREKSWEVGGWLLNPRSATNMPSVTLDIPLHLCDITVLLLCQIRGQDHIISRAFFSPKLPGLYKVMRLFYCLLYHVD